MYDVGVGKWKDTNSSVLGAQAGTFTYKGAWQHDIYKGDFTPYDVKEIELIKKLAKQ